MARLGSSSAEYPWVYLGGSSRRYKNVLTGETISREKYDRYYGSLFRRGAKSFHEAAKREEEEVRLSRPARGRGSSRRRYGSENVSGVRPLLGKQSRNVVLPFDVYYDGETDEEDDDGEGGDRTQFYEDAENYRDDYNDAVQRAHANPAIFAVSLVVTYENPRTGKAGNYTIRRIEEKHSLATYDEFLEDLASKAYPGDHFTALTFHIRFFDWATKSKPKSAKGLKVPKGFRKANKTGR